MPKDIRFLSVRLRAIAQATEVGDRVLKAMVFASGTEAVTVTETEGHFGTPLILFEVQMKKIGEIRSFADNLRNNGILVSLQNEADARTDEGCAFHFRLDKQKAYLGELELARGRDAIDVRMKVGVYPAKREEAVRLLSEWMAETSS